MSDENEKLIEDIFITKVGAKYPFIRAKGVNEQFGIKFFPSVYVIDPDGTIASVPDDRMPSEAFIEEHLANVSLAPNLPEDSGYDAVRMFWEKKDYKKLDDYLDKMLAQEQLGEEMREVFTAQRAELDKRIAKQVERVAKLGEGPDYGGAQTSLEKIEKDWKGLTPAAAAEEQLDRFSKDATIKKEIAAGKALERVLGKFDPNRVSQRKKLALELVKFAKRYEGTYAAKKATDQRAALSR